MSEKHHIIPVWFFVGVMLLIYGILILGSGLSEWSSPPHTVLAELHAPVWWGAILTIIGAVYVLAFRPK
jgi:FtsH-binding integral membrane protein